MPGYVKVSGAWKEFVPYVKVSGVWKELDTGEVRVSGAWKEWHAGVTEVAYDSGWRDFTTCSLYFGGNPTYDWTNFSDALTENSTDAYFHANGYYNEEIWTDTMKHADMLGTAIPTSAVIEGIEVRKRIRSVSPGGGNSGTVQLMKAGSTAGSPIASSTNLTSSYIAEVDGGSTNMWGTTWTPADINHSGFGVTFAGKAKSTVGISDNWRVDLDVLQVRIYGKDYV